MDRNRCSLFFVLFSVGFFGCAAPTSDTGDENAEAPVESTGTTANALAADLTVYTDAVLAQPWQNWGWSSTVNTNDTTAPLVAAGSRSQIKTTLTNAWGALSLARTTGDVPTATYESVTFDIRSSAASRVHLSLQSVAGGATPVQFPITVTTSWTRQTIALDKLRGSLTSFGKVSFMGERAGDAFYLDNVQFVARGTSGTIPPQPQTPSYETVVTKNSWLSPYFLYVPKSYDATHRTPAKLLVWMHGCGGNGYGDAWAVSPGGSQSWITVSVGGRDGACWDVSKDSALVMAALDDVKKHLNIDPRRAVVGGYSSGGDLAYRTAFYNAPMFAGVIADNTAPFSDTGSSASSSIGAAGWRFNVAHLAHLQDYVYSIDRVRQETDQLKNAGFPVERIERNGQHWDNDSGSYGTQYDRRTYLLPYLDRGWVAPAR